MAPAVGSLSLFSKMMSPRNWRSDSAVSLENIKRQTWSVTRDVGAKKEKADDAPLHPLGLEPRQTGHRLSGDSDHSESVLGVVRQQIVVVLGDCERVTSSEMSAQRSAARMQAAGE